MIPDYFKNYAHDLTLLRIEENKKRYEGTNKQRDGIKYSILLGRVSREYYTEYIGILAELIIRDFFEKEKQISKYEVSTLIKKSDFVLNDQDIRVTKSGINHTISIKGCENSLKANLYAVLKEQIDWYVFVLFTSKNDYLLFWFKPSEVKEWEINKSGKSPYFEKKIIAEKENEQKKSWLNAIQLQINFNINES